MNMVSRFQFWDPFNLIQNEIDRHTMSRQSAFDIEYTNCVMYVPGNRKTNLPLGQELCSNSKGSGGTFINSFQIWFPYRSLCRMRYSDDNRYLVPIRMEIVNRFNSCYYSYLWYHICCTPFYFVIYYY